MTKIFSQFIFWYFFEVPKKILKAWKNFLSFNLEFFSLSLLFKTFFAPWRKYIWTYPKSFDLTKYLEVFFSNLISRALGMIIRAALIFIGVLTQILIFLIGMIVLFGWLILPGLLLMGLGFGLKMI